jgi:hypothetical protein
MTIPYASFDEKISFFCKSVNNKAKKLPVLVTKKILNDKINNLS